MNILLPNGQIAEPSNKPLPPAWFRLAFRPLFLLGTLFSVVSVLVWAGIYSGHLQFQPYGGGYWWHIHEMLFGFAVAIIAGFLLTAVQTWTKVPSIKGKPLMALVAVWLAARVLLLFPQLAPTTVTTIVDLLFLPLAAGFLARPIIKARMWRNLMFVPILLVMALVNAAMHYTLTADNSLSITAIGQIMVLLVTLVMCIMGGRVFPMFTANGTRTPRVPALPWLEILSVASVLAAILISAIDSFSSITLNKSFVGSVFALAGVANFIRALRWRIWVTLKVPLVWSLHLSYWGLSIGLMMLGIATQSNAFSPSLAIHAITVGGMGMMILSMISRVSLGHTGRSIVVGGVVASAFVLMLLAFVVRVFVPLVMDNYGQLILITAVLWALAYGIFVAIYTPILTKPRVDGGPG